MSEPAPILVVDDEELIAAALGEILRQAMHEVVTFSQPLQALEELKKRAFSVVISDQRMPGLSGLELLAEARRLQPNATRILMTGVLNLDTVIEAINQGEIFRFLVKPWLREEFLATISNALQRYELLCQNSRLQESAGTIKEQLNQATLAHQKQSEIIASQKQELGDLNLLLEQKETRGLDFAVSVLEAFDPAIGAQTRCVARVCQDLAAVLDLAPEQRRVLQHASCLYDFGLLHLPKTVVRSWQENPDSLDQPGRELIRRHPILSQELAVAATGLDAVGQVVRAHHEWFDGAGYPDGLAGEKIPWLARLLVPVVAYASSNLPATEAIKQIQSRSGSEYDPEAVRQVLRALPLAGLPNKERQVTLRDLIPGMILAKEIYSHNGILLVPQGERLTDAYIKQLKSHASSHPMPQSFAVYC